MKTKESMEIADVANLEEFSPSQVIKKVPIMTENLVVEVFFIDSKKKRMTLRDSDADRIHYVIGGEGKLTIGEDSRFVKEGMIILIPKTSTFYYSTDENQLIVLCMKSIRKHDGNVEEIGGERYEQ